MAGDIDYIFEKLGNFLINSETILTLVDDVKISKSTFRSKDEILSFLMNDVFTCRLYISCFDSSLVGCNVPSDQYSAFFIENDTFDLNSSKEVNDRFISLVKDGSIGFPDASVSYFNNILSPIGISIT